MKLTKLDGLKALKYHTEFLHQENAPERVAANKKSANNRSFYYNDQWTSTKQSEKEDLGQYMISLNRSKKYIEGQVGLLTGSVPEIFVHPYGEEDTVMSDIANKVLNKVFDNAAGKVMLARVLKFGAVDNISYAHVKQDRTNQTVFDCKFYNEVMPNQECSDPFFRDAEKFWESKYISVKKASAMYGIPETELNGDWPIEWNTMVNSQGVKNALNRTYDRTRTYVRVIQTSCKEYETIYKEGPNGEQVPSGNYNEYIVQRSIIGYRHCFETKLPVTIVDHNYIPFYCEDTANIYKLGSIEFIKEQQRLLNASFGIMLLNAQMSSSSKLLLWEDQVPDNDLKKFRANYAKVGSVSVLKGDGKDTAAPVFAQAQPLANAYYQITNIMMQEMEFNMMPNQLLGMDTHAEESRQSQFKNYEMMLNSMRMMFTIYEGFFAQLGKVLLQYYFTYTDKEIIARVLGIPEKMATVENARNSGLDITNQQNVDQWMQQRQEQGDNPYQLKRFVSDLTYAMKYINTFQQMLTDTSWIKYDIIVSRGSYLPSYTLLRFFMKYELFKDGVVDNETVLDDLPLPNKDQIKDRVSQLNLMQEENTELKGALQKLQKELDTIRQSVVQGEINLIQKEHENKMRKEYDDARQKNQATRKIQGMQHKTAMSAERMKLQKEVDDKLLELKYLIAETKLEKKKNDGNEKDSIDVAQYLIEGIE